MGIGKWDKRKSWPLSWLKTGECMKILGIIYFNDFETTCEENWSHIAKKVEISVNMLSQRQLSIFQKSIIINSLILSKVWYISHTLPPVMKHIKKINACVFRYIWSGTYHPVNRNTLCLHKEKGGLGIINVYFKSMAIFSSTVLNDLVGDIGLSIFYCKMRMSYLLDLNDVKEMAYVSPNFYSKAINVIRKSYHHEKFPVLSSKNIYCLLMPDIIPKTEENYPLLDWKCIWKSVNISFIGIMEREFIFKYVHGTLATNQRLKILSIKESDQCDNCQEPEYILHIFYFCSYIMPILMYFKCVLFHICNINKDNFLSTLMFNFKYKTKKDYNSAMILIVGYLYAIWVSKKKKYTKDETIAYVKSKFCYDRWLMKNVYKENLTQVFTKEYTNYVF